MKTMIMKDADFDSTPPAYEEVDMDNPDRPIPNPALDGHRVRSASDPHLYFVWKGGYKSWIPDLATYGSIFDKSTPVTVIGPEHLKNIANGSAITSGALLARASGEYAIYLITNNTKNHISSPATLKYCHFGASKPYPHVLIDFIPSGITIDYEK